LAHQKSEAEESEFHCRGSPLAGTKWRRPFKVRGGKSLDTARGPIFPQSLSFLKGVTGDGEKKKKTPKRPESGILSLGKGYADLLQGVKTGGPLEKYSARKCEAALNRGKKVGPWN